MGWLTNLFSKPKESVPPPERMHCIRFMTERGEQLGMLLTHDEFRTAVQRWINTIDEMPIDTIDSDENNQMNG